MDERLAVSSESEKAGGRDGKQSGNMEAQSTAMVMTWNHNSPGCKPSPLTITALMQPVLPSTSPSTVNAMTGKHSLTRSSTVCY